MTWAKNYGDRFKIFGLPDKRAKAIEKLCAGCGTGVETRKTYCGPCYDVRLQSNIEKNRARYKAARSPQVNADVKAGAAMTRAVRRKEADYHELLPYSRKDFCNRMAGMTPH